MIFFIIPFMFQFSIKCIESDVDFEFHAKQWTETSMVVNINKPKQMRFEISKLGSPEVFILANWNKNDRDSSCRFDSRFNNV
jgi:hypothetical protein